jgi:release factor glutamine methyltransferase
VTAVIDGTIGTLRRRVAARLAAAFTADGRQGTAALDARLLVAHALDRDPAMLPLDDDKPANECAEAEAMTYADRRIAGEPVARIVGHKEFWGLDLALSAETLVPRPDTETVVEAALAGIDRQQGRRSPVSILDLGTGSGAILLALLSELPEASGVGVDLAEGAARTARRNAERLGFDDRARFVTASWADAIDGRFDIVVANPPYVETTTIDRLALEVRRHDPHLALDGGTDGLDGYREIIGHLDRLIGPQGSALLEIGAGQARQVAALGEAGGWIVALACDLAGIQRVAILERPKSSLITP